MANFFLFKKDCVPSCCVLLYTPIFYNNEDERQEAKNELHIVVSKEAMSFQKTDVTKITEKEIM